MAPAAHQRSDAGTWAAFLGWTALAIAGQAALLGITQAGPFVTYHHVRVPAEPGPAWWGCVALLVLQLACVTTALARGSPRTLATWGAWLAAHVKPWHAVLLASLLGLSRA